jgi:hypothetical protein
MLTGVSQETEQVRPEADEHEAVNSHLWVALLRVLHCIRVRIILFERLCKTVVLLWTGGLRAPVTRRAMLTGASAPGRDTHVRQSKGQG